jgi:hypothetical protein
MFRKLAGGLLILHGLAGPDRLPRFRADPFRDAAEDAAHHQAAG